MKAAKVGERVRVGDRFGVVTDIASAARLADVRFDDGRRPAVKTFALDILTPIEQPDPIPNSYPAVWDLVLADIGTRDKQGEAKYRTRLQPHNGRDFLRDAYEEALDLVVYLRGAIFERDGK